MSIVLKDVWKAYNGTNYVLRGINLSVKQGEYVVIQGKSGAGKSTLLRIMGLLESTTKGDIFVLDKNAGNLSDKEASKIRLNSIGFVFQSLNLIPHLTILENLELPLYLAGKSRDERREAVLGLLEKFGMAHLSERYPSETSFGEQQRAATIRALVNNPKIILADEPAAHLDDENTKLLFQMLESFRRNHEATIVVTSINDKEINEGESRYILSNGVLMKAN